MAEISRDVAVIGAGTAGLKAYKAATAAGVSAAIIERGPGGSTCTRDGCMPSKLLIAAGRAAEHARRGGLFGVHAGPVTIDGRAVMARVRRERDYFVQSVLDDYHAIPDADRLHGEARFTSATTLQVGDTTVRARAIIIATGAHPTVPAMLDPVKPLVHTHETIFDIENLPKTLAVIGAGPLGLELAQAFARLGVAVTVLDKGKSVGRLSDPDAMACAKAAFGRELDLRLGVTVAARMAGGRAEISWTGDSKGAVTADMVLAATGRPPSLDSLDLATAGLKLDDKGVPCFDHASRRCGDSEMFICGDADAWRPVLHEAARGGEIAGFVAAGGATPKMITDLTIAFTEPNLVEVGARFDALPDDVTIATVKVADNGRARIDGDSEGVVRLYADPDGKLLGATIVATGGEHLGQVVTLAIGQGMDAAAFADQAWYHPTLEEMLQEAARQLPGGNPRGA